MSDHKLWTKFPQKFLQKLRCSLGDHDPKILRALYNVMQPPVGHIATLKQEPYCFLMVCPHCTKRFVYNRRVPCILAFEHDEQFMRELREMHGNIPLTAAEEIAVNKSAGG